MMNKSKTSVHILLVCVLVAVTAFSLIMCDLTLGSLNINGARSVAKRASLFKLFEIKKLDVVFVQETHSDTVNEREWRKEWPGQVFQSHKLSNSGGVGLLFLRGFTPCSVEVEEIICGHILKVKA